MGLEEGSWRMEVLLNDIVLDVIFNYLMLYTGFLIFNERNLVVYEILPSSE